MTLNVAYLTDSGLSASHSSSMVSAISACKPLSRPTRLIDYMLTPNIYSFRCIYHGQPFTLHPPHIPLTSGNICRVIRSSPSPPTQHFAVPYVLKLLAETEEGTETLAGFEAVSFAGAAVPVSLIIG
jgi:hypothetical protein